MYTSELKDILIYFCKKISPQIPIIQGTDNQDGLSCGLEIRP